MKNKYKLTWRVENTLGPGPFQRSKDWNVGWGRPYADWKSVCWQKKMTRFSQLQIKTTDAAAHALQSIRVCVARPPHEFLHQLDSSPLHCIMSERATSIKSQYVASQSAASTNETTYTCIREETCALSPLPAASNEPASRAPSIPAIAILFLFLYPSIRLPNSPARTNAKSADGGGDAENGEKLNWRWWWKVQLLPDQPTTSQLADENNISMHAVSATRRRRSFRLPQTTTIRMKQKYFCSGQKKRTKNGNVTILGRSRPMLCCLLLKWVPARPLLRRMLAVTPKANKYLWENWRK